MLSIRDFNKNKKTKTDFDFEIALAGNPNVGKSTVFNALTGLKQHTGNWSGKTVVNATGFFDYEDYVYKIIDLPGVYSLNSNSEEESVANEYLNNDNYSCVVIVADATNLERNLSLVLQILKLCNTAVLCLNLCDEAKKKGIYIDTDELSLQLGIPIVCTSAKTKVGLEELKNTVYKICTREIETYRVQAIAQLSDDNYESYIEEIYRNCTRICNKCQYSDIDELNSFDRKVDKIMTSKATGIPIMLLLLCVIFWITIVGANYISDWLSAGFEYIKVLLSEFFSYINANELITDFLINGVYTTLSWVVSVMLPPMAIFFPIFSLLEDSGYLPRIAFNLDGCFKKCGAHGKQSLTMAMGFGCNACGVMGCRIIDSKREKNIAILTNSFIPCNGKLPTLIAISSIFIVTTLNDFANSILTALVLLLLIIFSVMMTLLTSKILSNTILKGQQSSFMLELPPYRKPQFLKTIVYSLKDRAWFVLLRAVCVAIPAGAIIWCMANVDIQGVSLLSYCTDFLDPVGKVLGLDGVIIMAFLLGFPANETVIPIILMSYTSSGTMTDYSSISELSYLLQSNGWTIVTAICFLVMCMFHFPCSTTCLTIYKETKSLKLTALSIIIPTLIGVGMCLVINCVHTFF